MSDYLRGRPAPDVLGGYASLCDPLEASALVAQWEATDAAGWQAWRWLVRRDAGEVVAAVPGFVQAGRTAMLFPPRVSPALSKGRPLLVAGDEDDELPVEPATAARVELLTAFVRHLTDEGVALLQMVLPAAAEDDAAILSAVGFQPAADLLYLACDVAPEPPATSRLTFRSTTADELPALIDRTYEGTLDCPALNGLRDTADVVAGYLENGVGGSAGWRVAEENGAVVGCVLTTTHPSTLSCELIYMGLIPTARGRALGGELIREAKRLARLAGMEQSVLAVDAANRPALDAYQRAGYQPFDRRRVWLRSADR